MKRRICWKRGMRLTDDILRKSSDCMEEQIGVSLMLSAVGRFGLLPCERDFNLQLDINKGFVEVNALDCLGLTKSGDLVDIQYDTRFSTSLETRVALPPSDAGVLLVLVEAHPAEWHEVNDGYEQPDYSFSLVPEDYPISAHSFPVGRLVNESEFGWHLDDVDFVPPCLFVSSHKSFMEQRQTFYESLLALDKRIVEQLRSDGRNLMRTFWPAVRDAIITIDKEKDIMTPMQLYGYIQKIVSHFATAIELDDNLNLGEEDKQTFYQYSLSRYNYKDVYKKIKEGLSLSAVISEKMGRLQAAPESQPQANQPKAPTIADSQLLKSCTNSKTRVVVTNNEPGATVYFTTDGSEPTLSSQTGMGITLSNGFSNDRKREPDKSVTVRIMACLNGQCSRVNTYEITLHKDIARWTGIEI